MPRIIKKNKTEINAPRAAIRIGTKTPKKPPASMTPA